MSAHALIRTHLAPAALAALVVGLVAALGGCREDVQLAPPAAALECEVCAADGTCEPAPDGSACADGVCLAGACAPVSEGCEYNQGFVHVTAGGAHTCAMGVTGQLLCWGDNIDGQLGLGDVQPRLEPSAVAGGPWELASAGNGHTCGQRADNTAWCWGQNNDGQLGIDSQQDQNAPAALSGDPAAWAQLAAGGHHTCGIDIESGLWCWGDNEKGALGTGGGERALTPQSLVTPAVTWREVALGQRYTCAVDWNGDLWCWGENADGALGLDSLIEEQPTPAQVAPGMSFTSVAAGGRHTCAIASTGDLYCWGRNADGELGLGDAGGPVRAPALVDTPERFETLALGAQHSCGVTRDGALYCWGENDLGQLGLGDLEDRDQPTRVGTAADWTAVAGGSQHTCGLRANGALFCWGDNLSGQLGVFDVQPRSLPTQVCSLVVIE